MAGFEYGNTRLRAMRGRLFPAERLKSMAGQPRIESLLNALARGRHKQAVETALVSASGYAAVVAALGDEFEESSTLIRGFYADQAQQLADLVWQRFDVDAIKGLLRGAAQNASPAEIGLALLPVGTLSAGVLAELARASDEWEVVERLASLRTPFARPLLQLRARVPHPELFQMELALERWYISHARQGLESAGDEARSLVEWLDIQADLTNVLTVLRLAQSAVVRRQARAQLHDRKLQALFVGPGRIPLSRLELAARREDPEAAARAMSLTGYEQPLQAAIPDYRRTGRISAWERRLRRFELEWSARRMRRDPLGIGVLIGYLALELNELRNLRRIALGIELGSPAPRIREGLELIT